MLPPAAGAMTITQNINHRPLRSQKKVQQSSSPQGLGSGAKIVSVLPCKFTWKTFDQSSWASIKISWA
jgi:hypothetical protein